MTLTARRVLAVLGDNPASGLAPSQISVLLWMTTTAIRPALRQFTKDGWVFCRTSESDRRMRPYLLTDLGRQQYQYLCYPRQYRPMSDATDVGTTVTACQYLGTRDNRAAIGRMLGTTAQASAHTASLHVNDEPMVIGQWVIIDSAGKAELLDPPRFARHYHVIDE